jgi:hypothetical protein
MAPGAVIADRGVRRNPADILPNFGIQTTRREESAAAGESEAHYDQQRKQ